MVTRRHMGTRSRRCSGTAPPNPTSGRSSWRAFDWIINNKVTLELACWEWRQISPPFFFSSSSLSGCAWLSGYQGLRHRYPLRTPQSEFVSNICAAILAFHFIFPTYEAQIKPDQFCLTITLIRPSFRHNSNMSAQSSVIICPLYLEYTLELNNGE